MPQYLLAVHGPADPFADSPPMEEMAPIFEAVERFNDRLRSEGSWVFAGGLMAATDATTVDATGDTTMITDGPYAETKEYLGGFWVITATDLDAALKWAADGSAACAAPVEVRAFQPEPEEAPA